MLITIASISLVSLAHIPIKALVPLHRIVLLAKIDVLVVVVGLSGNTCIRIWVQIQDILRNGIDLR